MDANPYEFRTVIVPCAEDHKKLIFIEDILGAALKLESLMKSMVKRGFLVEIQNRWMGSIAFFC